MKKLAHIKTRIAGKEATRTDPALIAELQRAGMRKVEPGESLTIARTCQECGAEITGPENACIPCQNCGSNNGCG